jgi:hypothetical protein
MFFIDYPYVSSYLAGQLESRGYPVADTPEARQLLSDYRINFISLSAVEALLKENPYHPVYTNSENALRYISGWESWFPAARSAARCKDKAAFRDHIRSFYPDYFYTKMSVRELESADPDSLVYPCIIKPTLGFFSLSVHHAEEAGQWLTVVQKVKEQANKINHAYPNSVVDTEYYIVEQRIEGEEYAVDAYYDIDGKPVILGIYHHLFSSGTDVSDRVYTTSVSMRKEVYQTVYETLELINSDKSFRVFPMHAELRISEIHGCIPIEVNPMRFGGWCTTADLNGYAQAFGQYNAYLEQAHPDILHDPDGSDDRYSVVVLDNSTGYPSEEIAEFNFEKMRERLDGILEFRPVDHHLYNIFGFLFVRTPKKDVDQLTGILTDNLRDFISVKETRDT